MINVGDHFLLPDTPDQRINIYVSGDEQISGMNFRVQVADGGPEAAAYGLVPDPGEDGPTITAVDMENGTIFEGNLFGDSSGFIVLPQIFFGTAIANLGAVAADGLLATVVVDTTGFTSGTWELKLDGTHDGSVELLDAQIIPIPIADLTINNGHLAINRPPVAVIGATQAVGEGSVLGLDASGSSDPDADVGDAIADYAWDLDDDGLFGETGVEATRGDETGAAPTFSAAGLDGPTSWPIKLRVVDSHGGVSAVVTTAIAVANVAPTVDAGGSHTVAGGFAVSLLDATYADDCATDTHTVMIDWGDSTVAAGTIDVSNGQVHGTHVYTTPGVYSVEVTVTDDDGDSGTDTMSVEVVQQQIEVDAGVALVSDEGAVVGLSDATFVDLSGNGSYTAVVDWGDGTTTSGTVNAVAGTIDASHVFVDDGTYTVVVTVIASDDNEGSGTTTVVVGNVAPQVDPCDEKTVDEGETVALGGSIFTDPGSADIHTVTIDWGDGTSATTVAIAQGSRTIPGSHVYADDGAYTVTIMVDDGDASDTATTTVLVANVAPEVTAGANRVADEGSPMTLDGASYSDATDADTHTVTIDWGDGTSEPATFDPATGVITATHTYGDDGTYAVFVTVTDDDGGTTRAAMTVTIHNVAPQVTARSDQGVDEGELVTLDGTSFVDAGIADTHTATVDWGDGTSGSVAIDGATGAVSGSHIYGNDGIYAVVVTVGDGEATGSATTTISVANVVPIVDAGEPPVGDEGSVVSLIGASFADPGTGDSHAAMVDWGDGTNEPAMIDPATGGVDASHVYGDDGVYTVRVTVADGDGQGNAELLLTVHNVAPHVEAGGALGATEGVVVILDAATFFDPGLDDTHTATINWGDGTIEPGTIEPGTIDPITGAISGSHVYATSGVFTTTVTVADDDGGTGSDTMQVVVGVTATEVVARHVFYNGSRFDGFDLSADDGNGDGDEDDDAIATDKVALLPGETATFENYTSYVLGLNGIMIDVTNLPADTTLDADDFEFREGNTTDAVGWGLAPTPSNIVMRRGAGEGGADRVTLVWTNEVVVGKWLQVTMLANDATGLVTDDRFYFGNAPGETGNAADATHVNANDMLGTRDNQRNFMNPAPIDFHYDFNRDGRVNAVDMLIVRNNPSHLLNALTLITPSAEEEEGDAKSVSATRDFPLLDLLAMEQLAVRRTPTTPKKDAATAAVDKLLATW